MREIMPDLSDFLKKLEGQTVKVNGSNLSSLSLDDNNYFIDKYIPSISFKIIYLLN